MNGRMLATMGMVCLLFSPVLGVTIGLRQDEERELLVQQLKMKYAGYTNSIATLKAENLEIAKDRKAFLKAYSDISVPEYWVKTNVVRLSRNATMTTVVTNAYRQEARVRKLVKAMKDERINAIYEKYNGENCSGILDEFMQEWKMTEQSYADTKKMLAKGDKTYRSEVARINQDAKREYDEQIADINRELDGVRRSRAARLRQRGFQDTRDLDDQIRDLESRKRMATQIFNNNKYASSLSEAGTRKMDGNDSVLAQADLRNQQQNLYMVYSNKLKGDLISRMDAKIESNNTVMEMQIAELNRIDTLLRNRERISVDVAHAIVVKQMDEALGGEYGITATAVEEKKEQDEALRRQKQEEDEERAYQKQKRRRQDAADDEERDYQKQRQRDDDAMALKEREHAMEVERATRDARMKLEAGRQREEAAAAREERRYRQIRRRELDRMDDLDRAAVRKLLEAGADAIPK